MGRLMAVVTLLLACHLAHAEEAGDADAGQAVFQAKCSGCHNIGPGAQAAFGPALTGVVGRQAGTTPDYQYSDAMRGAGFTWTEEKLMAYIDDPKGVVPGSKMNFWWLGSDQKLRDLVAYLKSQPAP